VDQDRNSRILRERAVELAREYEAGGESGDRLEVTVFRLGNERYAFESELIREVVPCGEYTPLPCVPPHVAGIMNLRGRILSLIDLGLYLELPVAGEDGPRKVIVLSRDGMEFGVLVAGIEGNLRIPPASLREDYPAMTWAGGAYLAGVTGDRLILLDGRKLLNDPALIVNDEIG